MGIFSGLGGKVAKAFAGFNPTLTFYKWLVCVLILIAATTIGYREGLHDGENRAVAEKVASLETQIVRERETIVKELEVRQKRLVTRMEEINKDSREAARLQKELDSIGGTLNELIKNQPSNPACAPSRSVWEAYKRLAEATNPST